jgi:hypothetical protein
MNYDVLQWFLFIEEISFREKKKTLLKNNKYNKINFYE